jgi:hypothetical protein
MAMVQTNLAKTATRCPACLLPILLFLAAPARAQTDEIQVYDATIADEGQFDVEFHNNYTPDGRKTAAYPGGVIPDHSWNGVPEYAYGVTDWFEAGMYLPVYTITNQGRAEFDSAKLRALFVSPYAANRTFFYGINFELSYNAQHWEPTQFSGEIRPILGLHLGAWDLIVNPIMDTDFKGLGRLDFVPCERIAYNLSPEWALAAEHYADFGQLDAIPSVHNQVHTLFAVVDYKQEDVFDVEAGIGRGFTQASDDIVLKLMIGLDF